MDVQKKEDENVKASTDHLVPSTHEEIPLCPEYSSQTSKEKFTLLTNNVKLEHLDDKQIFRYRIKIQRKPTRTKRTN